MNAGQLAPSIIPLQFKNQLSGFSNNVTRIVNAIPDYTIRAIPAEDDMSRVIIDTPKVLPPLGVAIVAENRTANQTSVEAFFNAKARHGAVIALSLVSNARLGIDPGNSFTLFKLYTFLLAMRDLFCNS
ncbi:unnamed protein product [Anisakis simplex]|uniref:PA domain-containing protein n=1 Tax=Anisakis simplex TaxID=6269 RepID=A0A0M3JG49_ANISI|nr:unnamed protein product [Anisakis simplex]